MVRVVVPRELKNSDQQDFKKVLIVGAGDCGILIARELRNAKLGMKLIGFVDDDLQKYKLQVLGSPVLGTRENIPGIVEKRIFRRLLLPFLLPAGNKYPRLQEYVRIRALN